VLFRSNPKIIEAANKTSLIIRTNNNPGSLYRALGVFAERSINISKLQSRPIIGKAWQYIFYLDIDKGLNDKELIDAFNDLKVQKCELKILGSYLSGNKT
jgi:prephenate dehydratase